MKGKRPRYAFSLKSLLLMICVMALFAGANLKERSYPRFVWDERPLPTGAPGSSIVTAPLWRHPAHVMGQGWPIIFRSYWDSEAELPAYDASKVRLEFVGVSDTVINSRLQYWWLDFSGQNHQPGWPTGTNYGYLAKNLLLAVVTSLALGIASERLFFRRRRAKGVGEG